VVGRHPKYRSTSKKVSEGYNSERMAVSQATAKPLTKRAVLEMTDELIVSLGTMKRLATDKNHNRGS